MATPSQYIIKEVALATMYDIGTGKALVHLPNLKTSGLTVSGDTNWATGGRGNARIAGFSSNKQTNINLENATFSNEVLAMMTGNDLIEGAIQVYKRDEITAKADAATIKKSPVGGSLISLYRLNADGSHGEELTEVASTPSAGEYSISDNTLSFSVDDVADNERLVAYYYVETGADAKTITISSDGFPGSFKLVLDCLVRNVVDQKDYAAQVIVHQCKAVDDWSLEMSADGDPSVHTIPLEVLKPVDRTEMWTLTVYDEDQIA